jgi:hypothetical protein
MRQSPTRCLSPDAGPARTGDRRSAIRFVTPSQRHAHQDKDLLAGRAAVYELARHTHPQRWSKKCRNWHRVDQVHLNPDMHQTKEADILKKAAWYTTFMRQLACQACWVRHHRRRGGTAQSRR